MRRSLIIPVLLSFLCAPAIAQEEGRARLNGSGQTGQQQVDPQLWRVLENWSTKSAGIERLEGEVLRRTYNMPFCVERLGTGYFYYESPDKGRLDVTGVEIDQKLLDQRKQLAKQHPERIKWNPKTKEPFTLESDNDEKWVCDGERVTSMNLAEKQAHVYTLRPEERGRNIMNGPMPFLFGLPPQQAVNRFHLKLITPPGPKNPYATLEALPKQASDAKAWKQARVMLDTRTGLPAHVQLVMPAGTESVTYSFSELKVNRGNAFTDILGPDPFNPRIPRGWQVKMIRGEDDAGGGQPVAGRPVVPNLVGMPYKDAEARLKKLGLNAQQIKRFRGNVARQPADVYRVQEQLPEPGTPINGKTVVSMRLWIRS